MTCIPRRLILLDSLYQRGREKKAARKRNARYQKFDPTLSSDNFNGRDFLKTSAQLEDNKVRERNVA